MKKLLAVLTACMAVTCIFSSCGDEKKDDSSVSESSSVSVRDEAESTTETVTEELSEEETEYASEEITTHEYIDADATVFLGKWECEKILVDGEAIDDLMGMPVYISYQYDIMEDGTAGLSESLMAIATEDDMLDYTWGLISENEIEIVGANGSVIQFKLDGDYLISSENNTEIYLKKVDEFTPFDFQAFVDDYQSQQNDFVLTPVETDAEGNIIESSETTTAE
ncbi:MAG: hypothetical protein K2I80_06000 [Ruminococcus sp.]|nr:hypothetical protein [Ruminococcus sp.]MDE6849588.1 hypothetical protein [Ruminococcus sp.]